MNQDLSDSSKELDWLLASWCYTKQVQKDAKKLADSGLKKI